VCEDFKPVRIDTGFIVYNEVTYPNLTRLFAKLGVETRPSKMSFSVQHVPSGLEYCGSGLNGIFAQRKNLVNLRFLSLLKQINRFNKQCLEVLDNDHYGSYTLSDYVREKDYASNFLDDYLVPMSSAIWSTPPERMLDFPAVTLVRFFKNHGLLGLNTQHPWRTVVNGSWSYRDKLIAPFRNNISVNRAAARVARENGKAIVFDVNGGRAVYDRVIFACHADQALNLLAAPTEAESRLLGAFNYQANTATLHTDASVMPKTKRAWSSWNYRLGHASEGNAAPSTVYYMNSLQRVSQKQDYFISLNDRGTIDPKKVIFQIEYEHPIFSPRAIAAQKELHTLNQQGVTYFCGSYFNYGFHEDAFTSAINLCGALTGRNVWE
jgi:predicted NAD/FAD-binding protein